MRLGALMDIGGYVIFIEAAMVIFLAVFLVIAIYVFVRRGESWKTASGIPLHDASAVHDPHAAPEMGGEDERRKS